MRCGAEQPQHVDGHVSSSLALRYMHRTLQVSPEEAERLRQAAVKLLSYGAWGLSIRGQCCGLKWHCMYGKHPPQHAASLRRIN